MDLIFGFDIFSSRSYIKLHLYCRQLKLVLKLYRLYRLVSFSGNRLFHALHFPFSAFRRFDHATHHHVVSLALLFLNILLLLQSQDHVQAIRFDFHLATWPFLLCKLAPNGRTLGLRFRAKYTVD